MTTFAQIYTALGLVITESTQRKWWVKKNVRSSPKSAYALIYITRGRGVENDVVETDILSTPLSTGEEFIEIPWGITLLNIEIEFFRDASEIDTALNAACRFSNSLKLTKRLYDLWKICGLSGLVDIMDFSTIFREDTEARVRLSFSVYANLSEFPFEGMEIFDIQSQEINIEIPIDSRFPQHYLFFSATPNSLDYEWPSDLEIDSDTPLGGYILPPSLFSILGEGFWFDSNGEGIVHNEIEIIGIEGINTYGGTIFYSRENGLLVYKDPRTTNEESEIENLLGIILE